MKKSYLSQQVKLMTLSTTDLFTDEEYALYMKIVDCFNEMERLVSEAKKKHRKVDAERREELLAVKKAAQSELSELIKTHMGTPRTVRVASVIDTRMLEIPEVMPEGITWSTLRNSRRIAEFMSDMSRFLGLKDGDVTFDKIIVKWKSQDILHQIVLDGFYLPLLHKDGTVEQRHFQFVTASAGMLRRDKIICMSDQSWNVVENHVYCGLNWDYINSKGGLNVSKLFAYTALCCGATEPFTDISMDETIVIKDFENVRENALVDFIDKDYSVTRCRKTVTIKDTDGAGMALPSVLKRNQMIRGPWTKGLISPFDFIKFCRENGVEPKIKDAWGLEHDLVKEKIKMILTTSQVKLWKLYNSWEDFKTFAKITGWTWCATNYEEPYISDSPMNYQFLESLVDFTDDEINQFTQRTFDRIKNMATDQSAMLKTMRADEFASMPYNHALAIYPALLRDGYTRETLKAIKKRWTMDAQSGRILCNNKRLFVVPDFYAACEHWFLGIENPQGLLKEGEVGCKLMRDKDKVDVLRSPSLYMEHAVMKVSHDPKVYKWLTSNAIYTSCHGLESRILQFDCDGDQLNTSGDQLLVSIAERNIAKYDVVPLFYDANEVPPEQLSRETMYEGLIRAHNSSGIGVVSNNLCKLWNSDDPDFTAAKLLCYYNNQVIDGAKLPVINSYENYPQVVERIEKAIGGKNSRMPHFFKFSRNGRHRENNRPSAQKKVKKPNNSVLNRICDRFSKIGNINMNFAKVPPFNHEMMLPAPMIEVNEEAVELFCYMDTLNDANLIEADSENDLGTRSQASSYDALEEEIKNVLVKRFGSLEEVYPSIVWFLFTGDNENKVAHKQMFWRVFGEIANRTLENNLISCTICPNCGIAVPFWAGEHTCRTDMKGFLTCIDCGRVVPRIHATQKCRCDSCQEAYRKMYFALRRSKIRSAAEAQKKELANTVRQDDENGGM